MIFKTFDSDIDKWTAKVGIFGKSFNDLGVAIDDAFDNLFDNGEDFWESLKNNLFPKKADIQSQMLDIDKLYPKIDTSDIENVTKEIVEMSTSVSNGTDTWQKLFDTLPEGKKHLVEIGQQLEGQIITTDKVAEANQNARQATIDHNNALKAQTASAKVAKVAMGLLSTAMNALASVIIAKVIQGFIDMANAEETAIEKTKESTETYRKQIATLKECKEKYLEIVDSEKTYVEKTKEINKWKETLVETYGFEKDALEKVNAERKTGIELIEDEIKKSRNLWLGENAEQSKKAKSKIETDLFSDFTIQNASVENKTLEENIRQEILNIFDNVTQDIDLGNSFLNYDEQISLDFDTDTVYKTKEKIEEALAVLGEIGYDNLNYQEKELIKQLNSHKEKIDKIIEDYGDTYSTFNEYTAQNLFSQFISQSDNQISSVTKDTFDTWSANLLDMAGESKALKSAIQDIIDETFPQFVKGNKSSEKSINSATDAVYKFKEISEELKTTISDTFANQSKIQSTLDKIREGASLSTDEVYELATAYPELSDKFKQTADGWTIASQDLIDANDEMIKNTKDSIREQISNYQKLIDTYENSRESILNKTYLPSDALNAQLSNIPYTSEEVEEARKQIEFLNLTLSMFGLASDNAVDKLDVLNKKYDEVSDTTSNLVNKAKSLSDAFAEQNENGSLSVDTILSLIENGYAAALVYDAETNAMKLDKDACLALVQAKIIEQETSIAIAKNDAFQKKLEAEKTAAALTGDSILYTAQAVAEYNKQMAIASGADELLTSLESQEEAMAVLRGNLEAIMNGTYGGSGSSSDPIKAAFEDDMRMVEHWRTQELISEEEYLNALEKANEEHYAKSTEHYDDYLANIEKIYNGRKDIFKSTVDEQIKALDEQLEKGFISPAQYQSEMTKLMEQSYGMGSKYYGTEFATENYNEMSDMIEDKDVDVYESKLEELKKANDGSIEAERQFIEKWKSLNKKMFEDSDPKKYKENLEEIAEYEDDWLVRRTENEKTYWENLKQEAIDYYDKEIEKLREIADEEERISKEKELQNNLIKAQQKLEEAKKNRNQLIFRNGTFEYVENQEKVQSAIEEVNDAQKAIDENNREKEIEYWEKRKKRDEDFYDALLLKINNYIDSLDGNVLPISSDSEVISKAGATEEANKAQNAHDNLGKDNSPTTTNTSQEITVETNSDVTIAEDKSSGKASGFETATSLLTMATSVADLTAKFTNLLSDENRAYYNKQNNELQLQRNETSPAYAQAIYNNSTVDNSIRIGTINNNVTVAEGTTKQQVQSMLDGFASEVVGSLKSLRTKTT